MVTASRCHPGCYPRPLDYGWYCPPRRAEIRQKSPKVILKFTTSRLHPLKVAAGLSAVSGLIPPYRRCGGEPLEEWWRGNKTASNPSTILRMVPLPGKAREELIQLAFLAAIHVSILRSKIGSGSDPVISTWAWKSRMSNLGPSSASAFLRSRWMVKAPIL